MVNALGDCAVEVMEVVKDLDANGTEGERRDGKEELNKIREEVVMMIVFF